MSYLQEQRLSWEEERAKYKTWLDSLTVGDEVALPSRSWYSNVPRILKVAGFTPKYIKLSDKCLYSKENGCMRSGGYTSIKPVTDEMREEIRRHKFVKFFENDVLNIVSEFTTEQLAELHRKVMELQSVSQEEIK